MSELRVEQWKRKLLDLSLRNPLLNVRDSLRFLPLEDGLSFCGGSASSAVILQIPPLAGAGSTMQGQLDVWVEHESS